MKTANQSFATVMAVVLVVFLATASVLAAPSSSNTSNSSTTGGAPTGSISSNLTASGTSAPSDSSSSGAPASSSTNNSTTSASSPPSSGTSNTTSQVTSPASSGTSNTASDALQPTSSNTSNTTFGAPGSSNTDNTTGIPPGSSNTNNTTNSAPGSSNTNNTTSTAPGSSNTNNTTGTPPGSSNTDNTTSGGTTPGGNGNNPPPSVSRSGGGGAYISLATAPCVAVVYGEWNSPVSGYQYRNVISQSPNGCALTAAQQAARSRTYSASNNQEGQVLGVKYYADGSLLRGLNWRIYVIINGKKQLVKNWGELCNKYRGQEIINVSPEVLDQYPEISGVKVYADGSLMRGPDKKIYLAVNGGKYHIKSLKELANYKGKKIIGVSYDVLSQYPEVISQKANICGRGNLLRGPDKKVYLIVNGKRKLITNLQSLIDSRCREITNVDGKTLESYPLI